MNDKYLGWWAILCGGCALALGTVTVLSLIFGPGPSVIDPSPAQQTMECQGLAPPPQCVRVHSEDTGSTGSLGTGAYIGPGLVVTANHVVRDRQSNTSVSVMFPKVGGGWTEIGGEVLVGVTRMDFALIRLESLPPCKPLAINSDRPAPGDRLSFMGYGGGEYKQVEGIVNNKRFTKGWLEIDCVPSAVSGDSGGPVLDARGQYTGTLWGGDGKATIFTPSHYIIDKIEELGIYLPIPPAEPEEPGDDGYRIYEPLNPATIAGRYHNRTRTNNFYRRVA
jgi:S1-C subfamily serine protease